MPCPFVFATTTLLDFVVLLEPVLGLGEVVEDHRRLSLEEEGVEVVVEGASSVIKKFQDWRWRGRRWAMLVGEAAFG